MKCVCTKDGFVNTRYKQPLKPIKHNVCWYYTYTFITNNHASCKSRKIEKTKKKRKKDTSKKSLLQRYTLSDIVFWESHNLNFVHKHIVDIAAAYISACAAVILISFISFVVFTFIELK